MAFIDKWSLWRFFFNQQIIVLFVCLFCFFFFIFFFLFLKCNHYLQDGLYSKAVFIAGLSVVGFSQDIFRHSPSDIISYFD